MSADNVYEFTPDVIPVTDDVEYPCEVCGREAGPYGGRGRKPKFCPDHKKSAPTKAAASTPKNNALAAQAADALVQINSLVAFGATVMQYEETGETLRNAQDEFRNRAHAALITDPKLCQAILRGGPMSARAALILSYGMMATIVGPIAVQEFRDKRAAKLAIADADDGA
jgi:hypothetical protein